MSEPILITGLSNREFIAAHARPGRVGLIGGASLIDRAIQRAERHLDVERRPSQWSHALIFQGVRADGEHWVIESDLELHRRHIRLGVQENRADKYFDEAAFPRLAILDFQLPAERESALLREGLDLVARRVRYSLREILGTLLALPRPERREQENRLARDHSFYCSALVQHLFRRTGLDLAPGLDVKHTTPEDLARSPLPHTIWVLDRGVPERLTPLRRLSRQVRQHVAERRARRSDHR